MPTTTVNAAVERAFEARRLLDHPYYQRWQDGELTTADLGQYAEQYRWFETTLPEALAQVAGDLEEGAARRLVEANLADELSSPEPHIQLFDAFADSVGARSEAPATETTGQLVGLYREAAAEGPVPALAVIAAYESQAADIAATKADALRRHHALTEAQTAFWDVHAGLESDHASWTVDALESLGADPAEVERWATRSAVAWWSFLDEREAGLAA